MFIDLARRGLLIAYFTLIRFQQLDHLKEGKQKSLISK